MTRKRRPIAALKSVESGKVGRKVGLNLAHIHHVS
jgi:hypothetical protein